MRHTSSIPFVNTRLSPKGQKWPRRPRASHGQHSPNGMAGVFGQDQPAGLLNYFTWPVIFIDSRAHARTPKLTLPPGPSFPPVTQP